MKHIALVLGLVGVGLLSSACSGASEDPLPFASEVEDPVIAKLSAATSSRWFAHTSEASNKPFLYVALDEGRPVLSSGKETAAPLAFLESFASDLGLDSTFARSFTAGAFSPRGEEGLGTVRYEQRVPGTDVPVFDGELLVGLTEGGNLGYLKVKSRATSTGFARHQRSTRRRPRRSWRAKSVPPKPRMPRPCSGSSPPTSSIRCSRGGCLALPKVAV